jgi:hypothetical protein
MAITGNSSKFRYNVDKYGAEAQREDNSLPDKMC